MCQLHLMLSHVLWSALVLVQGTDVRLSGHFVVGLALIPTPFGFFWMWSAAQQAACPALILMRTVAKTHPFPSFPHDHCAVLHTPTAGGRPSHPLHKPCQGGPRQGSWAAVLFVAGKWSPSYYVNRQTVHQLPKA